MTENNTLEPRDRPKLNPKYLLRWEKSQNAYILLYPEGVIKLNQSASEILKRCTGGMSVDDIIAELSGLFIDAPDITQSIYKFLENSYAKGWIDNAGR